MGGIFGGLRLDAQKGEGRHRSDGVFAAVRARETLKT